MIFQNFALRVAFGIVIPFERHHDSNFWFKTNRKARVHHLRLDLWKINPSWPMEGEMP